MAKEEWKQMNGKTDQAQSERAELPAMYGYGETMPNGKKWPVLIFGYYSRGSMYPGDTVKVKGKKMDPIHLDPVCFFNHKENTGVIHYSRLNELAQNLLGTDTQDAQNYIFTHVALFFKNKSVKEMCLTDGKTASRRYKIEEFFQQTKRSERFTPH